MENYKYKYIAGQISPDEYWNIISKQFNYSEFGEGCKNFSIFVKQILDSAFISLSEIDRNNNFWSGTNGLPTIFKLSDYANFLNNELDQKLNSAWLKIALELVNRGQHLIPQYWQIIYELGDLNFDWIVFSAWNMSPYWSDLNVSPLSNLINKNNFHEQVKGSFTNLIQVSKPKIVSPQIWVDQINELTT